MAEYELPVGCFQESPEGLMHIRKVEIEPLNGFALRSMTRALQVHPRTGLHEATKIALTKGLTKLGGKAPQERDLKRLYQCDVDYVLYELACWELINEDYIGAIQRECGFCGQTNRIRLNLREFEVKRIPEGEEFQIPFELPLGLKHGERVAKQGQMRLLTFGDRDKIVQTSLADIGKARLQAILLSVKELETFNEGDPLQLIDLDQAPSPDLKYLERLYNDSEPGVKPPTSSICSFCGSPITYTIDWARDFLLLASAPSTMSS